MKKIAIMAVVSCLMIMSLLIGSCSKTTTTAPATTTKVTTNPTAVTTAAVQPKKGGILRLGAGYDGANIGYPAKSARVAASWESAPAIETLLRIDVPVN